MDAEGQQKIVNDAASGKPLAYIVSIVSCVEKGKKITCQTKKGERNVVSKRMHVQNEEVKLV